MKIVIDSSYEKILKDLVAHGNNLEEVRLMDEAVELMHFIQESEEGSDDETKKWRRLYEILDYAANNPQFSETSRCSAAHFILNNCEVNDPSIKQMKKENKLKGKTRSRIMEYEVN